MTPVEKIFIHFKNCDPVLYAYLVRIPKLEKIKKDQPDNYFGRLCREIVCQQLSDKAGDVICSRFQKLFGQKIILPADVLALPHEKLRAAGMSNSKVRYLKNLAGEIVNGNLPITRLDKMTDQEITSTLTKVKGIGPWTAEMFLMFTLGREDVFSFGDLGLNKAMQKIYGIKSDLSKKRAEKIISKWSPYKSYASRILWASLELLD